MTDFDYDLFVIGAGSGGVRASRIAAGLGARVGVAEELYMGGTCVNVGCVPKKLFSYAAHYHHDFKDSQGFGWQFPAPPKFDWQHLLQAKNTEIKRLNGIYDGMLERAGVTVYKAHAVLKDQYTVAVGMQELRAKNILIATGGWPFVPEVPGHDLAITSNELFTMASLPRSILIVGGGYIAVEFAGILSGLGVKTTLSYRGAHILRGFDVEVAKLFTDELCKYSELKCNTDVKSISHNDPDDKSEPYRVCFKNGDSANYGAVFYATGRKPKTEGLGLEKVGVKLANNGAVIVNEHFQSSVANIFAVGDVIDRVALTPVALAEGQLLAHRLFGAAGKEMNYENIPTAVFSQPNIASVGKTEEEAREQCKNLLVFKSRFTPLKHTLSGNSEKTFLKMLVDKETDRVLGIHMMGPEAGEIIQGLAVAVNAGATKTHFDMTLGIHPTTAEEFVTMRTPEPQ